MKEIKADQKLAKSDMHEEKLRQKAEVAKFAAQKAIAAVRAQGHGVRADRKPDSSGVTLQRVGGWKEKVGKEISGTTKDRDNVRGKDGGIRRAVDESGHWARASEAGARQGTRGIQQGVYRSGTCTGAMGNYSERSAGFGREVHKVEGIWGGAVAQNQSNNQWAAERKGCFVYGHNLLS
jgi:hypothetical protein